MAEEQQGPGEIERGVQLDLNRMPADIRRGGIAAQALSLARALDGGDGESLPHRDAAAYHAQLRHCQVQLRELAPGEVRDDTTDTAQKNREARMLHAVPDS